MTKLSDAKKKYSATPHHTGVNGLVDYRQNNAPPIITREHISPRRLRRSHMLCHHKTKSVSMDTVFIWKFCLFWWQFQDIPTKQSNWKWYGYFCLLW